MPSFSARSRAQLASCHPDLQAVFNRVIEVIDCTIIEGHRDEATQQEAYRTGRSQIPWPEGKHNHRPSLAVDAAPYPIDWNDPARFTLFAGVVLGIAESLGVSLRWGGDWNRNWQTKDTRFHDLPHFELIETAP